MASPQPTDSHTRISNELYTQILMRDFTKRQRAILDLLIRLSYGCGKKRAYIPMMKYFEVCGVQRTKVASELKGLRNLNVIDWDETIGFYWLIKDYEQWQVEEPPGDIQEMFSELLRCNLSGSQNGNQSSQNGNSDEVDSSQNRNHEVPKTGTEQLPKREPESSVIEGGTKADEASITIDNYLDKKIAIDIIVTSGEQRTKHDYLVELMRYGHAIFEPYGISQNSAHDMAELLEKEQLPPELGESALRVARDLGKDEGFAKVKLRRWLQSNVKDVEAAKRYEDEVYNAKREAAAGKSSHKARAPNTLVAEGSQGSTVGGKKDDRYSAFYQLYPDA